MKFIVFDKDQADQVHILARSYQKKSSDSGDTSQFLTDFVNFDNIRHLILKKSFFFRE